MKNIVLANCEGQIFISYKVRHLKLYKTYAYKISFCKCITV